MKNEDVKMLIWRLDATLAGFTGIEWMEKVGRVARLKEGFFRCLQRAGVSMGAMTAEEMANLDRCFDFLANADTADRRRGAVFDRAASLIAMLLPDDQRQAL